jgi:glycosyltransferase involved in cell wall biosynthesis
VILPTVSNKHFDTLVHGFISVFHVLFSDAEVLLICNVANSMFAWIPRLVGKPTALNVDGLDRKRRKWNIIGQTFLHLCEMLSVWTPSRIVADSDMIAYGAQASEGDGSFQKLGLDRGKYILYVARLEPENNPELVIRAYNHLKTDWPLVVVGGNPYDAAYLDELKAMADHRVIFAGPVYGDGYWSLQTNAGVFVFAGEIGGVHPALVEAMAAGNAILYLDTPANRETAVGCGIPFTHDWKDLATKLTNLLASPTDLQDMRDAAHKAATAAYSWDSVVDCYEMLFNSMLNKPLEKTSPATE